MMLVGGVACTDSLWVWAAVGTGTGRIAPDLARRRFKAMVKGLFKASSKPITYKVPTQGAAALTGQGQGLVSGLGLTRCLVCLEQLFTTTALNILEDPALKDDFQRWATMESSLCALTTVERSAFRGLLMDFIQCRHISQVSACLTLLEG